MPVLKESTKQVRGVPRTEGDRVYIPIIDPVTGKPTGKEAVVSLADGDLAAAGLWYTNGQSPVDPIAGWIEERKRKPRKPRPKVVLKLHS